MTYCSGFDLGGPCLAHKTRYEYWAVFQLLSI
jgi:hypothetical protein